MNNFCEGQIFYLKPLGCVLGNKIVNRSQRVYVKFFDNNQMIKITGYSGDIFNSNDFFDCDVILDVSAIDKNRKVNDKKYVAKKRLGYEEHQRLNHEIEEQDSLFF